MTYPITSASIKKAGKSSRKFLTELITMPKPSILSSRKENKIKKMIKCIA